MTAQNDDQAQKEESQYYQSPDMGHFHARSAISESLVVIIIASLGFCYPWNCGMKL